MLRDDSYFKTLRIDVERSAGNAEIVKKYCQLLYDKFNIPQGLSADYITLKTPMDDASDFILYALSDIYLSDEEIDQHFSAAEKKKYSKTKYKVEKLKFPLEFNMVQINSSQWIGKITVQELMAFRDAQIITYNENTQRTMERKMAQGYEYYQIAINPTAVDEITDSYERDVYIPNTITLNISDNSEADFEYDEERHILRINSIKSFDILDGYHRYRAMSKAVLKNKKFDYEMELRIVNFSEEHARQFIWQEDQKTKMSKVDSDSYNQDDYAVYICERLANSFPAGIISRNKGIIDFAELVIAVRYFYATNQMKRSEAMTVSNTIKQRIREIIEEDPSIVDTKWPRPMVYCAICVCCSTNKHPAATTKKLYEISKTEEYSSNWEGLFNQRKATALNKLLAKVSRKGVK